MARTHTYIRTTGGHQTCAHMSRSDDECSQGMRGHDFLTELFDAESVPEFLLNSTKIHAWLDGSEIWGRAGFRVFFAHAKYGHISEPVMSPQPNNRVEVSAVGAGIRAVRNSEELCLYSDSKWCVDMFSNLQLYERRGWMAKGK